MAQPPPLPKVGRAKLMQTHNEVDAQLLQVGDHKVRAVITIGQQNIAFAELAQQLPQQGRFARLLAGIGADRHAADHRRCQRQEDHHPRDGKADARPLAGRLRIHGLVFRRIGHADRRAVDELDVPAVPQPSLGQSRFAVVGQLAGQTLENRLGQFRPGAAIRAGVFGARLFAQRHEQGYHSRHGRHATALLVFAEHLGKERPQGDRRRVDGVVVLSEHCLLVVKDLRDLLFAKRVGRRQAVVLQEGRQHQTKSVWQRMAALIK